MAIRLVEGWTGNIDYQLKADGAAFDLSAAAVVIVLADKNGVALTPAGNLSVTAPLTGSVRYAPGSSEIVEANSPYRVRFKVTVGGKIVYFPNGEPEKWIVAK